MKPNPHKSVWRPVVIALGLFLLGGCAFKPVERTGAVVPLPAAFTMYSEEAPETGKWWEAFGSGELNRLVEDALGANLDIRQAWARLRQAGALATQSGADKYPTLDVTGGYSHTTSRDGDANREATVESHAVGLSAGYEVDLWGRIRAVAQSGDLDYLASREDVNAAAMTVAGEVVSRWLEIQSQRRKKRILTQQVKANATYLELIELRFRNSISTALDVYQQRQNLARVKALLPPVEAQEQLLLHELALLLGRPAGSVTVSDADLPSLAPLPGLGLPADLLANRPDIRAAGLSLSSADWAVAAARANRLPSLSLTGTGQYSGTQLASVFNNWALGLAASIVGPIFDGGYREAEVEKARGVVDERLAAYRETVFTACKEVEDALVREKWQQEYLAALDAQLEAARISLNEAISRYTQGLDDYLPVLSALLSVQDLEMSLAGEQVDLLLYRVSLHRALGGGWTAALKAPVADGETTPDTQHNG